MQNPAGAEFVVAQRFARDFARHIAREISITFPHTEPVARTPTSRLFAGENNPEPPSRAGN